MLSKKEVVIVGIQWGYNSENILEVESTGLVEWLIECGKKIWKEENKFLRWDKLVF